MSLKVVLLSCLLLVAIAYAEEVVQEEETVSEDTDLIHLPGFPDLAVSESFLRAVGVAGAVVTGVAGIAVILSFLMPMVGFRSCMIFGGCQDATPYSTSTNSVYDHQQGGYQYGGFRKRSLEYVGPILKALTTAYDKYGPPAQQKKITGKSSE